MFVNPLWNSNRPSLRVASLPSQEARLLVEVVEVHMRRGSQAGSDSRLFWGLLSLVDPNK